MNINFSTVGADIIYDIDDMSIKELLTDIVRSDYKYGDLPDELPIPKYSDADEYYNLKDYIDEYYYELMEHEFYSDILKEKLFKKYKTEIYEQREIF